MSQQQPPPHSDPVWGRPGFENSDPPASPEADAQAPPPEGPDFGVYTMNQVVSYNLMRARRASGWTQDECARMLKEVTGKKWTNASLSAAERSWSTGRIKEFNANEILAFAQVFRKPIASFFMPIPDEKARSHRYIARAPWPADAVYTAGDTLEEIPQDPGKGWMDALGVLNYLLANRELMPVLAEDVNRLVIKYGLSWDPGDPSYSYYRPELEYYEEASVVGERESRRLDIDEELVSRGEWKDPDPLRANLNITHEQLRELVEEAAEAAVLNFVKGLKRVNRDPELEDPPF